MTAFVIKDSGLVVECWEVGALLPSSNQQRTRQRSFAGTPRMMQMGVGEGGVTGIDITVWAEPSIIWPPEFYSDVLDFSLAPSYVFLTLIHTSKNSYSVSTQRGSP